MGCKDDHSSLLSSKLGGGPLQDCVSPACDECVLITYCHYVYTHNMLAVNVHTRRLKLSNQPESPIAVRDVNSSLVLVAAPVAARHRCESTPSSSRSAVPLCSAPECNSFRMCAERRPCAPCMMSPPTDTFSYVIVPHIAQRRARHATKHQNTLSSRRSHRHKVQYVVAVH